MARLQIDIGSQMVTETGYNTIGITAKKAIRRFWSRFITSSAESTRFSAENKSKIQF
jgi:hypothetical protein